MAGHHLTLLLLTAFAMATAQLPSTTSDPDLLKIEALGRTARIGSIYDASTETFSSTSILSDNIPSSFITKIATPSTNTKMGLSRSYTEKRTQLDISLTATLSALMGLIKISGSANFLHEEQKKVNSVVGSLVYNTLTVEETLEIFYDETLDYISPSAVTRAAASAAAPSQMYVVVGVAWGCGVVVKFEDYNEENRDISELSGSMSWILNSLGNGARFEELEQISKFSMNVFADIDLQADDLPTNLAEVIEFIESVPRLVAASEEGKGKELFFYGLPLERIKTRLFGQGQGQSGLGQRSIPIFHLREDTVNAQIEVFEQISIVRVKLNDLYIKVTSNRDILNNTDFHEMYALKNSFSNASSIYKNDLKKALISLRSGKRQQQHQEGPELEAHQVFQNIEKRFREGDSSLEITENAIDNNFREVRLKIELVNFLKQQGALWIARSEVVDTKIIQLFKKEGVQISICGIHFYRHYLNETVPFLAGVAEGLKKGFVPIVVDCDFPHETCEAGVSQQKICEPLYIPSLAWAESVVAAAAAGDGNENGETTTPFGKIRFNLIQMLMRDKDLYEKVQNLGS